MASMQGVIVASNLLKGNHHTPDYNRITTVVFTAPRRRRSALGGGPARRS
jgi:pyruvate/2-oxoglutarate dehydrogenase complex dihydrolipoamide dehydrogenase (E3) component